MPSTFTHELVEAAIADTGSHCVHLDHGEDFEICKSCIDGGFTSVMIDGSNILRGKNRLTKQVVVYAHDKGVCVEGELESSGSRTTSKSLKRTRTLQIRRSAGIRGKIPALTPGDRHRHKPRRF
jgi:fructose/tagatose bisphosphate aldolase